MTNYKDIAQKLVFDLIVKKTESGDLKEEDLPPIAQYVLKHSENLSNNDHLIGFLHSLSLKWPIFQPLATQAEGKVRQGFEKQVVSNMIQLISKGEVSQAINLAKSIENN